MSMTMPTIASISSLTCGGINHGVKDYPPLLPRILFWMWQCVFMRLSKLGDCPVADLSVVGTSRSLLLDLCAKRGLILSERAGAKLLADGGARLASSMKWMELRALLSASRTGN